MVVLRQVMASTSCHRTLLFLVFAIVGPGSNNWGEALALTARHIMDRRVCFSTAAAAAAAAELLLSAAPARAEYGQSTPMAAPAFVPSPIRPTGEMAKTCEIVALGREDVCLKPLPQLSAYNQLQLKRVREDLEGEEGNEAVANVLALVNAVEKSAWADCQSQIPASGVAWIDLRAACKAKEPPAAVKALVKLASGL